MDIVSRIPGFVYRSYAVNCSGWLPNGTCEPDLELWRRVVSLATRACCVFEEGRCSLRRGCARGKPFWWWVRRCTASAGRGHQMTPTGSSLWRREDAPRSVLARSWLTKRRGTWENSNLKFTIETQIRRSGLLGKMIVSKPTGRERPTTTVCIPPQILSPLFAAQKCPGAGEM